MQKSVKLYMLYIRYASECAAVLITDKGVLKRQ